MAFSQVKEQELPEVSVDENPIIKTKSLNEYQISRKEILNLSPEDLGDITKNIPGVSLRSYGGLGGMKTFSARGFSSSHVGIIVDGFLIQNTQTNQIDLSTILIDNLEKLTFNSTNSIENIELVTAYFNSSNLKISTFNNEVSKDSIQLRANLKLGSFGQLDSYISTKFNREKYNLSFYFKFRKANGNYPFKMNNYNETYTLFRTNNELNELYAGLNFSYFFNLSSRLNIQFQNNLIDKGLPGAVILYNPSSNQSLHNEFAKLNIDYSFQKRKMKARAYLSTQYDEILYIDSGFLNAQGYQKSNYFNSSLTKGISFARQLSTRSILKFGSENTVSFLKANQNFDSEVFRNHSKTFADYFISTKNWTYQITAGIQHFYNQEKLSRISISKTYFNPAFQLNSKKNFGILGTIHFILRRTLRLPSFNELYYNNIGNTLLKPEIANQISLGNSYRKRIKDFIIDIQLATYYNLVENKIVAVPTKNLFVWSIQNVGRSQIIGSDFLLNIERKFNQNFSLNSNISYSYQHITDISNYLSETYRHLLAYSPKHILNASINFNFKKTVLNFYSYYNAQRYILNQNIIENLIPSFCVFDAAVFRTHKVNKNNLRYSFSVKNIFNNSYYFIKNYYMPGRNLLFSIAYEIN